MIREAEATRACKTAPYRDTLQLSPPTIPEARPLTTARGHNALPHADMINTPRHRKARDSLCRPNHHNTHSCSKSPCIASPCWTPLRPYPTKVLLYYKTQPLSSRAAHKLRFIIQDLVKNTSLEAGLLALQIKIPSGIHLLGSSEGGICFEFIFWSLRLLSLATLTCTCTYTPAPAPAPAPAPGMR